MMSLRPRTIRCQLFFVALSLALGLALAGVAVSYAAIAMLGHIPVYNQHRALFGYDPIRIGIGINAGPVMLGIIGYERFMQGTAISDAVNLASRLEALTKVYGVSLVISNFVLFGLDDPNRYHYRFLDNVRVKGKTDLVPVYEVFDADPPDLLTQKIDTREAFEQAVYEYHARKFESALAMFEALPRGRISDKSVTLSVILHRQPCPSTPNTLPMPLSMAVAAPNVRAFSSTPGSSTLNSM